MLTVTSKAAEKLKGVLEEEGRPASALRVIAMPNGHGVQYMMTLEDSPKPNDLVMPIDGVKVVVDPDSGSLLEGAKIDYVEGLMRSGFVITNPNAPVGEGCACGGNCDCGGSH